MKFKVGDIVALKSKSEAAQRFKVAVVSANGEGVLVSRQAGTEWVADPWFYDVNYFDLVKSAGIKRNLPSWF